MQNTTANYKLEINKPSRSFECKVTIGDNVYKNEDIVFIILDYPQPQDGFSIGNTVSQTLDLTLINKGDTIYSTSQIKVEIGLKIGSTIEYILMGIFNIDDIEKTDYTTKFTCYDNMIKFETAYFSSLGDKPTLQQVANELVTKTGVQFTGSLPSYTVSKLDGFTCREVLSYVASICGGNALITRDGKFTIKSLVEVEKAIDGNNYFNYKREEVKYKIGKISCQVDENNILSKGSLGADSMELQFENPWINSTILTDIYNKLNGLSYLGYSIKWQGDLSLDPLDIITVTDVKNITRKIPILSQKLTYTGGLTSEIEAKGETKNKNSFSSSGGTTNKVNRLVTEQAVIKEALIEKATISELKATNAEIAKLKVKDIEIENAIIKKADIEELIGINASIENLKAEDANITKLIAAKADITDLTASNIKFNVGTGGTLDLQTLLSKFVTGENGQFLNLTSSNVVIANAVIKDAMIENVSVKKLLAGDISTNKFRIVSDNGGIEIVGATQQFKDKNNKVRIQMGQDTQGNFNFILRGDDGTTTLIDHTGIKEKAIADKLIKSNMVADNAIGEKQINYSSLVTGLNKDTNTSLIQASKVEIDLTGQSLDIAFNRLKSNVDSKESRNLFIEKDAIDGYYSDTDYILGSTYRTSDYIEVNPGEIYTLCKFSVDGYHRIITFDKDKNRVGARLVNKEIILKYIIPANIKYIRISIEKGNKYKVEKGDNLSPVYSQAPEDVEEKIQANTTAITVAQGQIEGLIKDTSLTQSDVTTLKDNYTRIKATVDEVSTTVASHKTEIINLGTSVNKAQNTADNKAKVFTSTPTPPYKVGDIWTGGPSGEIMKCKVARASGNYVASDWEKASKYTDDTIANAVSKRVTATESSIKQLKDQIVLKVEATDVNTIVNGAVDNIEIGGRNLLKETSNSLKELTMSQWNCLPYAYSLSDLALKVGDNIAFKLYLKFDNTPCGGSSRIAFYDSAGTNIKNVINPVYIKPNSEGYSEVKTLIPANTVRIAVGVQREVAGSDLTSFKFQLSEAKLEKGTKCTSWTPAPEDVEKSISSIDSRLKDAELKITQDAIISTVQSTINTAMSSAINSANSNTDNKLKNYSTTSAMNSAITQSANGVKTEVSNTYLSKGDAVNTYATKSSMELTATQLKLDFSGSGGGNLISNSTGYNGTSLWTKSSGTLGVANNDSIGGSTSTYMYLDTGATTTEQYAYSRRFKLKPNTKYTFSGWFHNYTACRDFDVYVLSSTSVNENNIGTSFTHATKLIDFQNTNGKWKKYSFTFTTVAGTKSGFIRIDNNGFNSSGVTPNRIHWSALMLNEGEEQPWSPHPSEVYDGSTMIDATGVTIKNGALTIKNKAGTTVLSGDINGNLTYTGKITNIQDGYGTEVSQGGILFKVGGEIVGGIRSSIFESNTAINGLSIVNTKNGEYLDIGETENVDFNGKVYFSPIIRISKTINSLLGNFKGIQLLEDTRIKNGKTLYIESGNVNYPHEIYNNVSGFLSLFGDNGLIMGYKSGAAKETVLEIRENGAQAYMFRQLSMTGNNITSVPDIFVNGNNTRYLHEGWCGSVEATAKRISNLNVFYDSGWYAFSIGANGAPVDYGVMLHIKWNSNSFMQLVVGVTGVLCTRAWDGTRWINWQIK